MSLRTYLLSVTLLATSVQASELRLLDVDEVSVDTWKTIARRDPYQPEYTDRWTSGTQFNLGLRMLEIFRWDNHFHMDSTGSQLRNAGWQFQVTMDYFSRIEPFYYHHSQHALDTTGTDDPNSSRDFPLIDRVGLTFHFLRRK